MDSDTVVRVRYTSNSRSLELDHGRARFDVVHNVTRPFTVTAGIETVVAVGTSFDVERLGSTVLVTLIQGRVVIKGNKSAQTSRTAIVRNANSSWVLKTGQQLVASTDGVPTITPVDLQVATAWEAGRLIFKNETLSRAVERVNRYTDKPISVDPDIASLHISGAFPAGDVDTFVSAVTSYFPIQATTSSDNRILLERGS